MSNNNRIAAPIPKVIGFSVDDDGATGIVADAALPVVLMAKHCFGFLATTNGKQVATSMVNSLL